MSRGLGDVYKRQVEYPSTQEIMTELHEIEMKIGEEMQALEELLGLK